MKRFFLIIFLISLELPVMLGCGKTIEVDCYEKWIYYVLSAEDVNYSVVSFDHNGIRDSFVDFLDRVIAGKDKKRVGRMVWRENKHLHIINLSSFYEVEPEKMIYDFKKGLENAFNDKNVSKESRFLFNAIMHFFDDITIHSMESDGLGINWKDNKIVIPTRRKEYYRKHNIDRYIRD